MTGPCPESAAMSVEALPRHTKRSLARSTTAVIMALSGTLLPLGQRPIEDAALPIRTASQYQAWNGEEVYRQQVQAMDKAQAERAWLGQIEIDQEARRKALLYIAAAQLTEQAHSQPIHIVDQPTTTSANAAAFLACTRGHESNNAGGYHAVSAGGEYHGAYQFTQSTWNNTAVHDARPDLVGVDPALASPADQDELATDLYHWQGNAPWGGRC